MNKKIRELAEQAGFFPVPDETESDWEYRAENARYEKFAELIIQECITLCDKIEDSYLKGDDPNTDIAIGAAVCGYDIGKYFGVE